jgi:hypothetical protein
VNSFPSSGPPGWAAFFVSQHSKTYAHALARRPRACSGVRPAVGLGVMLVFGVTEDLPLHELAQTRKMYPHTPAHTCRPELSARYVAPESGVREAGVAFCFRVGDPLLRQRLL